jgi:acetylornithine deacetylase/succinyl-diaminopimelate desuccinylase-like protein
MGPGWLLKKGLTKPDLLIAAGFSYEVVTAHNGCLQMEVTVHGKMAHAAIPDTGVDALQGAVHILNALYAQNALYQQVTSKVEGIKHPYLNVGRIEGGTNTNVVPGKVMFKLDRRMIPEENPAEVEANIRKVIADAAAAARASRSTSSACCWPIRCGPCPATSRWSRPSRNTARRCSAGRSRPWARRCTPTCACMPKPAFPA